jgi:hypothetical protein
MGGTVPEQAAFLWPGYAVLAVLATIVSLWLRTNSVNATESTGGVRGSAGRARTDEVTASCRSAGSEPTAECAGRGDSNPSDTNPDAMSARSASNEDACEQPCRPGLRLASRAPRTVRITAPYVNTENLAEKFIVPSATSQSVDRDLGSPRHRMRRIRSRSQQWWEVDVPVSHRYGPPPQCRVRSASLLDWVCVLLDLTLI